MDVNNDKDDLLRFTPFIPREVYDVLPALLKECTDQFTDQREQDVILTSALTVVSGCFSSCKAKYKDRCYRPNLFSFIVAPPASGKGVMTNARLVVSKIHEDFLELNEIAMRKYRAELYKFKKLEKSEVGNDATPPEKPTPRMFLIPGNSSSASIYKKLSANDGVGIIIETEADSLTGAIHQEWGQYSDIFRKGFQHEPVSKSREKDDLNIEIKEPKISLLLSGTPSQVPKLIYSTEDGLCSRFIFYCFSSDLKWQDVTPCDACPEVGEVFLKFGAEVAAMKEELDKGDYNSKLSKEQFTLLNNHFEKKIDQVKPFEGEAAGSAVKRMGVIAFRLAMILTILREMEKPSGNNHMECTDEDFKTALALADVYFEHAMVMYSMLPKHGNKEIHPRLRSFYHLLPTDGIFTTKKAQELGGSLGLCKKTVGNHLSTYCNEGKLIKIGQGKYKMPKED